MDAAKILGSLLGSRSSGGGLGASILKEVLGGALSSQPSRSQRPQAPQRRGNTSPLGDLMREAMRRSGAHAPSGQHSAPSPSRSSAPQRDYSDNDLNEQSTVLIRAMINAAKSDGKIDQSEQESIIGKLGQLSNEEIRFLRSEFAAPIDVNAFADTVPLEMEEQVYAISLSAIELDENSEARYLQELAKQLRLDPQFCNEMHDRLRAPRIFR